MKLKNKRTGEIIEAVIVDHGAEWELCNACTNEDTQIYNSLAELNEEWTDAPEGPEGYYYINTHLHSVDYVDNTYENKGKDQEIGNYFETKEEAEKAVEKLKAWKRLKDKGFRFIKDWVYRYDMPKVENHTYFEFVAICEDGALFDDLDLLFGGEE